MKTDIKQFIDGAILLSLDSETQEESNLLNILGEKKAHVAAYGSAIGDKGEVVRLQFITNDRFGYSQKIIEEKRIIKKAKHRYNLVPPFARQRVTVGEGDNTDSRTIILRKTKQ